MNANVYVIEDYENEPPSVPKKQTQFKPNPERSRIGQFKPYPELAEALN